MAKNTLNFYIDYLDGYTQKFSDEVEDAQLVAAKPKAKLWRNRIMNQNSDLVFPYAWYFFSRPSEEYGYSMVSGKSLIPSNLYHAKDCRMTATSIEERTIFGVWEV